MYLFLPYFKLSAVSFLQKIVLISRDFTFWNISSLRQPNLEWNCSKDIEMNKSTKKMSYRAFMM